MVCVLVVPYKTKKTGMRATVAPSAQEAIGATAPLPLPASTHGPTQYAHIG